MNDDFNDIILFFLTGIFFIIFTDYIYKLGKKILLKKYIINYKCQVVHLNMLL